MNPRPLKQLLRILLSNILGHYTERGLCTSSSDIYHFNKITYEEYLTIREFIEINRPKWYHRHGSIRYNKSPWYWNRHDVQPRIDWLTYQIAKL